ncbi:AAA family ATPase [Bacillus subtilis]|uniref:AAA family ATPase n=3 Tax=Bacillus subtilis TaxID=1423 RepID=UPI00059B8D1B|nr:AAA family ATPase [Bacillus subtilis]KIN35378.1 hypothetical protein B4071_4180 [Bacillus subtilis]MDK7657317.1 AAA family ATPase [Bacillus subtilis]MDP8526904.1 AAA family ATPase [Bacillus subtilis]MEC1959235.1 AAA family ATPase [Bacillus subtilis]ODV47994.1 hypothetical protein BCM26_07275 [Bacillus subtilis]
MVVKSPKLIINKMVLIGRSKSYHVNFENGINIIHGDSDTGKSSILNLIDYLLGSKKVYMYDEIEQHGKYALLEVSLSNKVYTIKRDIFNPKADIEVFSSNIENIENVFPLEYSPNYEKEGAAGYFSDFLLSSLNIPIIKVKKSPSKDNSPMVRLSFRDIFKYCYFDQDDVGSRDLLDRKNYSLMAKNKETFKFLHNVLDTQITELQNMIGEKVREKKEIENKYGAISSFLLETKLSTEGSLQAEKEELNEKLIFLEKEKNKITDKMKSNNAEMEELRSVVLEIEQKINILFTKKSHKEAQLEQNLRLRKEYYNDINKLQTVLQVKVSISMLNYKVVECPLCDSRMETSEIKKHFIEHNEDVLKKEINSIKNRSKDLNKIVDELRDELFIIEDEIISNRTQLDKAKSILDTKAETFISPYISQRDMVISELSSYKEQLDKVKYFLKVRSQLSELKQKQEVIANQISELDSRLESLKEQTPSVEETLSDLGTYLKEFLEYIPIKNAYGISFSEKTFLPIVRDRDYIDLTSGGLRTLVSVGYITSILKNSLTNETNFPSLIMLDTIGKYLGKTKKYSEDADGAKESKIEGLDDPKKYIRIYDYLQKMSNDFLEKGIEHQIILVDNDFPDDLEKDFAQYVVKRFSTEDKEGYEIGFINNAN